MLLFRSTTPLCWTFFFKFASASCVNCSIRRIAVLTSVTRIYNVAAVVAGDVFRRNRSDHRFSPNCPKIPKTNGQAEQFWAPVPRAAPSLDWLSLTMLPTTRFCCTNGNAEVISLQRSSVQSRMTFSESISNWLRKTFYFPLYPTFSIGFWHGFIFGWSLAYPWDNFSELEKLGCTLDITSFDASISCKY